MSGRAPVYWVAKAEMWRKDSSRLTAIESWLRERRDELDDANLTRLAAAREVLRDRGFSLPPLPPRKKEA